MGAVVPLQDVLPAPPNHLLAGRSLFLLSLDHGLKQFQHDVLLVFGFGEGVGCLLVLEGQRDKGVAGVGVGWWWGWSWGWAEEGEVGEGGTMVGGVAVDGEGSFD